MEKPNFLSSPIFETTAKNEGLKSPQNTEKDVLNATVSLNGKE